MTEQILTTYKDRIRALTLIPAAGGRFEFSIDGTLVYSKLATGKFPDWPQIKREIDARMK